MLKKKAWGVWKEIKDICETIGLVIGLLSVVGSMITGIFIIALTAVKELPLPYQITLFIALFILCIQILKGLMAVPRYVVLGLRQIKGMDTKGRLSRIEQQPASLTQFDSQGVLAIQGFDFYIHRLPLDWFRKEVYSARRIWACWLVGASAQAGNIINRGNFEKLILVHPDSPVVNALEQIGGIAQPAETQRQIIKFLTRDAQARQTEVRWCNNMAYSLMLIANPPDDGEPLPDDMWVLVESFLPGINAELRPQFRYWSSKHALSCMEVMRSFDALWRYSKPPRSEKDIFKEKLLQFKESLIGILYDPSLVPTQESLNRLNHLVHKAGEAFDEYGDPNWTNIFSDYLDTQRVQEADLWRQINQTERQVMIRANRAILALNDIGKSLGE